MTWKGRGNTPRSLCYRQSDRVTASGFSRILHTTAVLAVLEGDWESAREFSDRVLAVPPQGPFAATRALLEHETGALPQGDVYLERLLESMRLIPPEPHLVYGAAAASIPMLAHITGNADRSGVAERAAGAVLASH